MQMPELKLMAQQQGRDDHVEDAEVIDAEEAN